MVKLLNMKRFVLVILYVFLCLKIQAATSFPFRHIGICDGLPDNYVKNVFGLPDGRLGVRTTSLLSFYDGKNFVNYPYGRLRYTLLIRSRLFLFNIWMLMEEFG